MAVYPNAQPVDRALDALGCGMDAAYDNGFLTGTLFAVSMWKRVFLDAVAACDEKTAIVAAREYAHHSRVLNVLVGAAPPP